MKFEPAQIFNEYKKSVCFKSSLGTRGMFEQIKLNERFFTGDQWHGAKCGNDRPLVRHNIIKRIGEYKMSHVLADPIAVKYSADGIPDTVGLQSENRSKKREILHNGAFVFEGDADVTEINLVMSALGNYQQVTRERIGFSSLCEQALRNAFTAGSSVIYTYWNPDIKTGLYADDARKTPITGDIECEVLDIENVHFADPYCDSVQNQPYIIISSQCEAEAVKREAIRFGATGKVIQDIGKGDSDGKVLVLTRLYKEYKENGEFVIKCVKSTEKAIIRAPFDTRLRMYPLTLFVWENKNGSIYGESEVTYLIPNQIAINRMITAQVWAAMTKGMPIMVVNGDTVAEDITNDPGQIIKVYGSNEDVAGAVHYAIPPDFSSSFGEGINNLIENTLTQSGANVAARGDGKSDNASAIIALQNKASMPLQLLRNRFYAMIEELSRIWADFWITQYGNRRIKMEDESGIWYMPFSAERYKDLLISARVDVGVDATYSASEQISILTSLYENEIINKQQYLKRLPRGIVPNVSELLNELEDIEEGKEK